MRRSSLIRGATLAAPYVASAPLGTVAAGVEFNAENGGRAGVRKGKVDQVNWEVHPPRRPPPRPNAQTVILLVVAIGLALLLAIALAVRYL